MANKQNSRASRHSTKAPKSSKQKTPKKKKSFGSIFLKVIIGLVFLACIGILSGMGLFWYYAKDAPELTDAELESANSIQFFAANGEAFQDFGIERRETISATEIPKKLEDAIVSVEDRRFYNHIGVDPVRIIGSAVSNLINGGKQGGSTLTQQLIKLSYFSTKVEDQNLRRKAQEAWMAVQLEQEKSKQEILTYYINKVYMSNGVYGMETASEIFYGKPLDELSTAQTALIAGMPNAPNYYDPYVNPEAAKQRRDTVLMTMLDNEKLSQQEYDEAVATPIDDGLQELTESENDWRYYDNYLKEVLAEVEEKVGKDSMQNGLDIYTNIDLPAQKRLFDIVNSDQYVQYPDDEMQVAATLIDAETGKVTAQLGGRNVEEGVVWGSNYAVNTGRDFGSTVKPLVDYGPAFEYLDYSTGKTIVDEPYKYEGTDISINNWDNQYMGTMTLRKALALSRNVPAAKLFAEVGTENIEKFLEGLGIQYDTLEQSNAISSNTSVQEGTKYGVSSLKMAAAYAAFANGGTYYEPQYVNKIVYQDGTEEVDAFHPEGSQAMKDTTAYMITDILKDVITDGTGTNAAISGLYQAGKTGTSNYTDSEIAQVGPVNSPSPDISFVGYTPHYSLAVWTGYEDKLTPVTSESSQVATDVYRNLMQFVSASIENKDWEMPDGLVRVGNELYLKDAIESQTTPSSVKTTPSSKEVIETTQSEEPKPTTESSKKTESSSTSESTIESTVESVPETSSSVIETVPETEPTESSTPVETTPSETTPEPESSVPIPSSEEPPVSSVPVETTPPVTSTPTETPGTSQ
ncbi:penicillin-binding protein 1A [Enterococcus sp. DIV2402]|uniref:Penicillin-binding protein 1A n=1 Tax=Candidatus Enterococcus lowellii TaxID=2230877 RepID=A0ABZ2SSW2_9ENTE|nr:PBP1A family penicillin-binding protein [Enterococcus sp. DIV2402]MBO0463999.1 PBP1A family penicillin-binding protein [Enterococcus sp. DIV2402]